MCALSTTKELGTVDINKLEELYIKKTLTGWHVPQKVKYRITIPSSNSASRYIYKRIERRVSKRYLYTHVHSSTIHNSQEVETTQVFTDRWMDQQHVFYTYNGVSKRDEVLIHVTPWMKLQNIMLHEIKPTQKDKYCMIPLIWGT